jgi:hypothetical protein
VAKKKKSGQSPEAYTAGHAGLAHGFLSVSHALRD